MSTDLNGVPFSLIHVIGPGKQAVLDFARSVSDETGMLVPKLLDPTWDSIVPKERRVLDDFSSDFYEHFEQKPSRFLEGRLSCSLLSSVLEDDEWHGRPLYAVVWRFTGVAPALKYASRRHPDLTFLVSWCCPSEDIAEAGFEEWHREKLLQAGALSLDAGRHLFMQFSHLVTGWNFPSHYGQDIAPD